MHQLHLLQYSVSLQGIDWLHAVAAHMNRLEKFPAVVHSVLAAAVPR